jgi:hypothetical protein
MCENSHAYRVSERVNLIQPRAPSIRIFLAVWVRTNKPQKTKSSGQRPSDVLPAMASEYSRRFTPIPRLSGNEQRTFCIHDATDSNGSRSTHGRRYQKSECLVRETLMVIAEVMANEFY